MLNFLAATQDIAVDGWALTMLSRLVKSSMKCILSIIFFFIFWMIRYSLLDIFWRYAWCLKITRKNNVERLLSKYLSFRINTAYTPTCFTRNVNFHKAISSDNGDFDIIDWFFNEFVFRQNVGWASTCNTVGQTAGYFLGNVVFMALESTDFCTSYLGADGPVVTLDSESLLIIGGWTISCISPL